MPPPMTLPNTLMSGAKPGIALRVEALRAAERDPKAGHHLVEDEQRAVLRAQLAQAPHERHLARTKFMLPAIGSIITQAIASPCSANAASSCSTSLYGEHQRVLHDLGRHAGAGRMAEGRQARAGLDQQRVGVAVVAALELDDLAAAGGAARQAQRAHRRLGARADQAHLLDARAPARGSPRPVRSRARSARRRTGRRRAAVCTASSTAGWPWPRIIGPQEPM